MPDGKKDPSSLHGSCPTLKGNKWSATKWIHVAPFGVQGSTASAGCSDGNENCEEWAVLGECKKNAAYMLKNCRKSCDACKPDPAHTNTGRVIEVPIKTA